MLSFLADSDEEAVVDSPVVDVVAALLDSGDSVGSLGLEVGATRAGVGKPLIVTGLGDEEDGVDDELADGLDELSVRVTGASVVVAGVVVAGASRDGGGWVAVVDGGACRVAVVTGAVLDDADSGVLVCVGVSTSGAGSGSRVWVGA